MLNHWVEWKELCAADLCSDTARQALREFAFLRFRKFAYQYAHRTNTGGTGALVPDAGDAWHLFETHLAVKTTKQGKRYKDWLFDRVRSTKDPPLDVVQGGASLMMRDVVRERHRLRDGPGNVRPCIRTLFHDEASRKRHRAGIVDRLRDRQAKRREHLGLQ